MESVDKIILPILFYNDICLFGILLHELLKKKGFISSKNFSDYNAGLKISFYRKILVSLIKSKHISICMFK